MNKGLLLSLIASTALTSANVAMAQDALSGGMLPILKPSSSVLEERKLQDLRMLPIERAEEVFVDFPPLGSGMMAAFQGQKEVEEEGEVVLPPQAVTDIEESVIVEIAEEEVEPIVVPEPLRLSQYQRESYREDLQSLRSQMATTRPGTVSRFMSQVEFGRFYLAHLMVSEGLSMIEDIPVEALTPEERALYKAVRTGLMSAAGRTSEKDFLLGDGPYSEWGDYAFWSSVSLIGQEDYEAASGFLGQAYVDLEQYPRVYVEHYLELMLEAALQAGEWTLAKEMALKFDSYPDLKEKPSYSFLVGLAAHKIGDNLVDAFDAYRLAARGSDVYAQRARLGIIQIGLDTYTMPLEDARKFLDSARQAWRGDQYEVEALVRLIEVNAALSDTPGALTALGELFVNFPMSEEMSLRTEMTNALLDRMYADGLQGELSLSEFVTSHHDIVSLFRFFPAFDKYHEEFADRLLNLGATGEAAAEYMELAEYMSIAMEEDLWPVAVEDISRVKLKAAKAFHQGGQHAEVVRVLKDGGTFATQEEELLYEGLLADSATHADEVDLLLSSEVSVVTPEYLRLKAGAYASRGDWGAAKEKYLELQSDFPESVSTRDMINLLLAAHRSDDTDVVMTVAGQFPEVSDSAEWRAVAKNLRYKAAPIDPLTKSNVEMRLDSATETIDKLRLPEG